MGQVSAVLRKVEGGYAHWCPACDEMHVVYVGRAAGPNWSFSGSVDRPTFDPSVLIRSGHYIPGQEGKQCWCSYHDRLGKPSPFACSVCHYFIRDGRIEFCSDSTHALAGQTVAMPALPEGVSDS